MQWATWPDKLLAIWQNLGGDSIHDLFSRVLSSFLPPLLATPLPPLSSAPFRPFLRQFPASGRTSPQSSKVRCFRNLKRKITKSCASCFWSPFPFAQMPSRWRCRIRIVFARGAVAGVGIGTLIKKLLALGPPQLWEGAHGLSAKVWRDTRKCSCSTPWSATDFRGPNYPRHPTVGSGMGCDKAL